MKDHEQFALGEMLASVDNEEQASKLIDRHLIRDMRGNLRAYGQQKFAVRNAVQVIAVCLLVVNVGQLWKPRLTHLQVKKLKLYVRKIDFDGD